MVHEVVGERLEKGVALTCYFLFTPPLKIHNTPWHRTHSNLLIPDHFWYICYSDNNMSNISGISKISQIHQKFLQNSCKLKEANTSNCNKTV